MKKSLYTIVFLLVLFGCDVDEKSPLLKENETTRKLNQKENDSSWTECAYNNGELRIDITNHNLQNYSINIFRKSDSLHLDLNELNIPWKTPQVEWVSEKMICISNWWSGPFARYLFVPLEGRLQKHIYLDKDIELTDSVANTIVYVDKIIYDSKLRLIAENLLNRKKKSIELSISSDVDDYPFYDSLFLNKSVLDVWIKGKRFNYDLESLR